ncbi:Asp/Glu/hydantoin racemase [Stutzerimonas nosocomialis]|uniref:aspartate/glutamate racemase family protein n=1 Tax=Stutzerimonas nosocomialis TaxID=1056496 RepID=UPI00110920B7|nr:aspartate/glutamate racemase family protein [Stutzerimonas nosocomialis]TLX54019.1 Asp/Glu/hydantoin racemase [Stutzerimonas nosocomialis]TLX55427.1 Asp/Glu/hydantoin racemase [Stutzerimonas nosocomialis]
MKIRMINPNASAGMARLLDAAGQRVKAADTALEVIHLPASVASIEGAADGVQAAFHLLPAVARGQAEGVQGFVIACFDDTGLDAARELAEGPVIGIGEAAMHAASMLSVRYSVLTSLPRSIHIIERNMRAYGLDRRCARVHAADIPVLELERDPAHYQRLLALGRQILEQDRSECLVLGCAGMSQWARPLQDALGAPVIDGVQVALKWVESLVSLGLGTSKLLSYRAPLQKQS